MLLSGGYHSTRDKALLKDATLEPDIRAALQSLYDDPFYKTQQIQGSKGLRRIYVGKKPWRLIFCIVEECMEKKFERKNACNRQTPKTVVVWIVYQRKKDYKKIRKKINFLVD
ncbi:MAG: hypothetical protein HeimC2_30350 [Candidatus Heimdallarchaeota archaeon LC_2]|nr:MAG: hypothetical protein HeimC2_30350 [Candidatus Heimdallarchaeota archaeon LC_2]